MTPETMKFVAMAVIMTAAAFGPGLAIAKIGSKSTEAMGRNPEAAPKIQTAMILAIAFAEAIAIYALVVTLILAFV